MNKIKQEILRDIEQGEIKRQSRLSVLAHDYFFWIISGVTVLCGGAALSVVLHRIATYQVRPYLAEPESVSVFIETLPYIWLTTFVILLVVAWFNYKQTPRAYKHHNVVVLGGVLLLSLVLGIGLFATGFGKITDEQTRERIPVLQKRFENRERIRNEFIERRGGDRMRNPSTRERRILQRFHQTMEQRTKPGVTRPETQRESRRQ